MRIRAAGKTYHPEHFHCAECKDLIPAKQGFFIHEGAAICIKCRQKQLKQGGINTAAAAVAAGNATAHPVVTGAKAPTAKNDPTAGLKVCSPVPLSFPLIHFSYSLIPHASDL